eukprot:2700523-Rhodomonas_salina.1
MEPEPEPGMMSPGEIGVQGCVKELEPSSAGSASVRRTHSLRMRRSTARRSGKTGTRQKTFLRRGVLGGFDGGDQDAVEQHGALDEEAEDLRVEDGARAVGLEAHGGEEREGGDGEDDGHLPHAAAPDEDGRARCEELAQQLDELH